MTISKEEKQNTRYTVKLYFAEIENTLGESRVFNIAIQDETVLKDFNIVKEAGGQNKLIIKTFEGIEIGNKLSIGLSSSNNKSIPLLSGIELLEENMQDNSSASIYE